MPDLNKYAVKEAIAAIIIDLDYDLHTSLQEGGDNLYDYDALVENFLVAYEETVDANS